MKSILTVMVILLFAGCQKQASTKLAPLKFEDVVLENKSKDEEVTKRASERRKKCPIGNPNCQPQPPDPPQPPPPTGSAGCILLDCDGQEVANTLWNVSGDFYSQPSGLSSTAIADVLNKCRIYYAFNEGINITTDESVFNSFPINKRIRVIITSTMPEGYQGAGGVAYINSFNWYEDAPCFVNSSGLSGNPKYIADASSHEAGHTLNLRHHPELRYNEDGSCYVYSSYLWGDLIMGASYYSASPRFDIAPTDCTLMQNDTLIINQSIRL